MKRALLLCAAAAALCAQQGTVIQTETREVLVEAVVSTHGGGYVRDLKLNDFHVFEDNKEQKLASVRFVSADASAGAGRSDMVLFFDEAAVGATPLIDLRKTAEQFIDAAASPGHRMAVVSFDGGLRLRQNFTDNAGRLRDALPQPNGSVIGRDAPQREMFAALRALAQNLGALPGRKIVVLFSGGVFAGAAMRSDLQEVIEACNRSGVAIYPVDVRPVVANGGMQAQSGRIALRMQTADVGVDMLFGLAQGTGGFVVERTNDLLGGLQTIAAEENAYYVLSYTPPESKEGKCHVLKVKVDRSGANIRARNSYCTTRPPDLLAGTVAGKTLEKRSAAGSPGNMTASIAVPYFYVSPGVARVHLVMDLTPGAMKFEMQKDENKKNKLHAEINLLGIASSPEGAVAARFSDSLKFDFDKEDSINAWRAKPIHYEKEFRIAPGKYSFTMAFGEAGQEAMSFGKVTKELAIDAWDGGPELSGIVLSREMHPAADLGLATLTVRRTPLVAEDMQVVPSTGTLFRKEGPGYFYFEAYDSDPASLRVRARVLDRRSGQVKWDTQVRTLEVPAGGNSPMPARAGLPLESLKEGPYRLEIMAADKSGKTVTRNADFDVESDVDIQ